MSCMTMHILGDFGEAKHALCIIVLVNSVACLCSLLAYPVTNVPENYYSVWNVENQVHGFPINDAKHRVMKHRQLNL